MVSPSREQETTPEAQSNGPEINLSSNSLKVKADVRGSMGFTVNMSFGPMMGSFKALPTMGSTALILQSPHTQILIQFFLSSWDYIITKYYYYLLGLT